MSILIRGMEMPENCDECPFNYDLMECVAASHKIKLNFETRPEECPLVEVEERWISVKDRLPEKGKLVIALIIGSDFIIQGDGETLEDAIARARKHTRITLSYLDDDGWNGLDGFPEIIAPAYWMPLPEPPKEEVNE